MIAQDWRLMAKAWRLMVEVDGKWLFLLSRRGRVSWDAHLPFCASRRGCKPFSALSRQVEGAQNDLDPIEQIHWLQVDFADADGVTLMFLRALSVPAFCTAGYSECTGKPRTLTRAKICHILAKVLD